MLKKIVFRPFEQSDIVLPTGYDGQALELGQAAWDEDCYEVEICGIGYDPDGNEQVVWASHDGEQPEMWNPKHLASKPERRDSWAKIEGEIEELIDGKSKRIAQAVFDRCRELHEKEA